MNGPQSNLSPGTRGLYISLFGLSAGVILWEILLTRIFSVILYYHYAFMAVAIAMFGLTAGAIAVFLVPPPNESESLKRQLGFCGLATGCMMAVSIAIQLAMSTNLVNSSPTPSFLIKIFILSALPFVPAGAAICIALTKFQNINRLYFTDLAGAAAGCFFVPCLLKWFGGPGAVIASGAAACAGSLFQFPRKSIERWSAAALSVGLFVFAFVNSSLHVLKIRSSGEAPLYESWNAFSRVVVEPFSSDVSSPGIHPKFLKGLKPLEQRILLIDISASTVLSKFNGDIDSFSFLKLDQASLVHQLRPKSKALIIGPGGGRDVLAALLLRQKDIRAVEINPNIIEAVNQSFGDFTGHLDRQPGLQFFAEDGRSYLSRTDDRFDVIQASLVDTVAATAAGAYAFTENGLYTIEAWRTFLSRLEPHGLLSVSRWYYGSTNWPVEIYRTIALAAASLRSLGVSNPADHIALVYSSDIAQLDGDKKKIKEGLATILVSPDPFSREDLAELKSICEKMAVTIGWPSSSPPDPNVQAIIAANPEKLRTALPLDISPPTDDRPFFFFHTRLLDVLFSKEARAFGYSSFNLPAVRNLLTLVGITLALGALLIGAPIFWPGKKPIVSGTQFPFYFAAIGMAFMFVEIGLIQRLSLFMGHPTYGFTVVLAGILLATGLGSLSSQRVSEKLGPERCWLIFLVLVVALLIGERGGAGAISTMIGRSVPLRIMIALAIIVPPGFLMGFPFPIGMAMAQNAGDDRTAWYWAINGALSVIASVLALVVSLSAGISATIWIGVGFYALAGALLKKATITARR